MSTISNNFNIPITYFKEITYKEVADFIADEDALKKVALFHKKEDTSPESHYILIGFKIIKGEILFLGQNVISSSIIHFEYCAEKIIIETTLNTDYLKGLKKIDPNINYIAMDKDGECYSYNQKPVWDGFSWVKPENDNNTCEWPFLNDYTHQSNAEFSLIKISDYIDDE